MILVTGANGMVGSYAREVFSDDKLFLSDLPELDITKKDNVFRYVDKYKPSVILHLAAETDVDRCEREPEHAHLVNTIGTQNVALACQEFGAVMVFASSGSVFNGTGRNIYTEFDKPAPKSVYSKTKYAGELIIESQLKKFFIFRAGWMIGGGQKKDNKFVGKIIELCKTRGELEIVNDKFGSLTFARDFLSGIKKVLETQKYGLYHLVNAGVCTRYEIAKEVVKILGKDTKVKAVSSDRFPLIAPRPESEAMKSLKLDIIGDDFMPAWQVSLKNYLKEWGTD
jgi:dTDP-4-dehydrorhamnose reductase